MATSHWASFVGHSPFCRGYSWQFLSPMVYYQQFFAWQIDGEGLFSRWAQHELPTVAWLGICFFTVSLTRWKMYLPMSFHNCWEFNTIGYMYEREFILSVIFRIYNGHLTVGYANKWPFFNLPRFQMIGT